MHVHPDNNILKYGWEDILKYSLNITVTAVRFERSNNNKTTKIHFLSVL